METIPSHPHGRHFRHCYAYEGSFCSCGGQYRGEDAGPRLEWPPAPFKLAAPHRVWAGRGE
ncbi:hypothetical protein PV721_32475 [Streptomyces sp. MB09-01]|uniref:hypothetical protein n=1 Tax=Streptomyces sp. MB09-01 TaxID=3028666 RepID=UPI0029B37CCD|nr:hypothetical protein [Streptomyces sp. MB09-01]MDX3538971.1 hypothetical protein [Streptomyces sp. MB09-01]